jgi:hypothetical protein
MIIKGENFLKEAIIAGITAALTAFLQNIILGWFNFDYSIYRDGFDMFLILIDFGSFMIMFLLIFKVLKKLFIKDDE